MQSNVTNRPNVPTSFGPSFVEFDSSEEVEGNSSKVNEEEEEEDEDAEGGGEGEVEEEEDDDENDEDEVDEAEEEEEEDDARKPKDEFEEELRAAAAESHNGETTKSSRVAGLLKSSTSKPEIDEEEVRKFYLAALWFYELIR